MDACFGGFAVGGQDGYVAFFAAGLEEYTCASVAAGACCAADAVQVVFPCEGGVVFDYKVDVGEVETAGCYVCGD